MPYVYIMSNCRQGTLYIGTTRNLEGRVWQHKNKDQPHSFTARYNLRKLVYYEEYQMVMEAVTREKQMKKWHRAWKLELISASNPAWDDLAGDWFR